MKVLAFNGSPRRDGKSQTLLAKESGVLTFLLHCRKECVHVNMEDASYKSIVI